MERINNYDKAFYDLLQINLIFLGLVVSFNSCQKEEAEMPNQVPLCKIISPSNNEQVPFGSQFTISISASDKDGSIEQVSLSINDLEIKTFNSSPYTFNVDTKDYSPGTYTIKAIAIDDANDITTNEVTITIEALLPEVKTTSISDLNLNDMSVDISCSIAADGGDPIVKAGLCWSTTTNPTVVDTKVEADQNSGDFAINVANLNRGNTYYFRAFATNGVGTSYGQELTLSIEAIKPEIKTKDVINISDRSAESGGKITFDGGAVIQEKGIVWGTSTNPTITNFNKQDVSNNSEFNIVMDNLNPNTTYYARAYARNQVGTSYGNQVEFKTEIGTPLLNDVAVTDINVTGAKFGSSVLDNGGSSIIEKGFVWSEFQNPTVNDNKILAGSGINQFTVELEDLKPSTKYYARSYGENAKGVGYSAETTFITQSIPENWLFYDDGIFEGRLTSTDIGDKFIVRFKKPNIYAVAILSEIKIYFHQDNEAGSIFDIKLYNSSLSLTKDWRQIFNGNSQVIVKNYIGQPGESTKYFEVNAEISEAYFYLVIENKSTKDISIKIDERSNPIADNSSGAYISKTDFYANINNANIMIRALLREGKYDNLSSGRFSRIESEINNKSDSENNRILQTNLDSMNKFIIRQFGSKLPK